MGEPSEAASEVADISGDSSVRDSSPLPNEEPNNSTNTVENHAKTADNDASAESASSTNSSSSDSQSSQPNTTSMTSNPVANATTSVAADATTTSSSTVTSGQAGTVPPWDMSQFWAMSGFPSPWGAMPFPGMSNPQMHPAMGFWPGMHQNQNWFLDIRHDALQGMFGMPFPATGSEAAASTTSAPAVSAGASVVAASPVVSAGPIVASGVSTSVGVMDSRTTANALQAVGNQTFISSSSVGLPMTQSSGSKVAEEENEWVEMEDHSSEAQKYWYNKRTNKSVWAKPKELLSAAERSDPCVVWKEFKNKDGISYYFNTLTSENSWTKPPGFKSEVERAAERRALQEQNKVGRIKFRKEDVQYKKTDEQQPPAVTMTKEESFAAFKALLREKKVNSKMRWAEALPLVIHDSRYTVLKTVAVRKECYEEYIKEQAIFESKEKEDSARQRKEEYWALLRSTKSIKYDTQWPEILDQIRHDERFIAFDKMCEENGQEIDAAARKRKGEAPPLRETPESLFLVYTERLLREERKKYREARRAAKAALETLFESLQSQVTPDMQWRSFVKLPGVADDPRMESLPEEERITAFNEWMEKLRREEKEKEVVDREKSHTDEKKQREAFRGLLVDKYMEGVFLDETGKMRWRTFVTHIEQDPRYLAMSTHTRITAKQLYKDYCAELAEKIQSSKKVVKKACKEMGLTIRPNVDVDHILDKLMKNSAFTDTPEGEKKHVYYAVLHLVLKARNGGVDKEDKDKEKDGRDKEEDDDAEVDDAKSSKKEKGRGEIREKDKDKDKEKSKEQERSKEKERDDRKEKKRADPEEEDDDDEPRDRAKKRAPKPSPKELEDDDDDLPTKKEKGGKKKTTRDDSPAGDFARGGKKKGRGSISPETKKQSKDQGRRRAGDDGERKDRDHRDQQSESDFRPPRGDIREARERARLERMDSRSDRFERTDKDRSDRPDRENRDRFDRGERPERERNDRQERFDRPERQDRADRGERFDRNDRPDRGEKSERGYDRADRGGRAGKRRDPREEREEAEHGDSKKRGGRREENDRERAGRGRKEFTNGNQKRERSLSGEAPRRPKKRAPASGSESDAEPGAAPARRREKKQPEKSASRDRSPSVQSVEEVDMEKDKEKGKRPAREPERKKKQKPQQRRRSPVEEGEVDEESDD